MVRAPFFTLYHSGQDILLLALNGIILSLLVYRLSHVERCLWRWVVQMVFLVAASVGLAWGGNTLARNWHVNFTQHYSEIFASHIFVDLAKHDPTSTRLCVMNYRYYPFFGSRRQYRLCRPRKAFSYAWLIAYLRDQQVNTVACLQQDERINSRYRGVSLWLREHPEVFVTQEEDASFIWADIDQQQLEKAAQP